MMRGSVCAYVLNALSTFPRSCVLCVSLKVVTQNSVISGTGVRIDASAAIAALRTLVDESVLAISSNLGTTAGGIPPSDNQMIRTAFSRRLGTESLNRWITISLVISGTFIGRTEFT